MQIVKYSREHKKEWDAFVRESKNGTFLFMRDYMDYHADRFEDCSHLFYEKERLLAALPANIRRDEHTLYSHQGLTYGGMIMAKDITATQVLEIFDEFLVFAKEEYGMERMIYKPLPYIYSTYPAEEDLYALFRHKATLVQRHISSTVKMDGMLSFTSKRRGKVRKAERAGLKIKESTDYTAFWQLLETHLQEKFGVSPVHTYEEITLLAKYFPKNIRLFEVWHPDGLVAGGVVYVNGEVAHLQYSSVNKLGLEVEALSFLFDYFLHSLYKDALYFDFGISDEKGGWMLNEGLIYMKESCAGRAVMYDVYELKTV